MIPCLRAAEVKLYYCWQLRHQKKLKDLFLIGAPSKTPDFIRTMLFTSAEDILKSGLIPSSQSTTSKTASESGAPPSQKKKKQLLLVIMMAMRRSWHGETSRRYWCASSSIGELIKSSYGVILY